MTLAIEEVLAIWRDAERVRDALPAAHPRREAIDADIDQLRAIYARMTDLITTSHQDLHVSADQIASATATLERVRARLGVATGWSRGAGAAQDSDPAPLLTIEPAEG